MRLLFRRPTKEDDEQEQIAAPTLTTLKNGPVVSEVIPVPVAPEEPHLGDDTGDHTDDGPSRLLRGKVSLKLRIPTPNLKWNQRTVTVSVEKNAIRVVAFKGKRVTAWRTVDLAQWSDPADSEELSVDHPDRLGHLQDALDEMGIRYGGGFWKLVDRVGIRRGRVVMDLSLYTTLMRHLQIPKVRPRYLQPVVVSEVLESLPFNKDEVDITWQLQKDDEGQSVFAIALAKERVDAQVKLIKESGLIPAAAYSKASALASASGVSNGVLVHLEASETALVLVHGWEPKVVHQLEFGSGPEGSADAADAEEHAGALLRAIEQVAGYYQPTDSRGPARGQNLPVILTGQTSNSNPVIRSLRSKLRRKVLTIDPPVRYRPEFPLSEYATNLGLFLADRGINAAPASQSTDPVSGRRPLNLLPKRHLPKSVPVFPASVFIILILLAIHPINITDRVAAKAAEQAAIARELRGLQRLERDHDVLLASYQENNSELESANDQMLKLEGHLESLQVHIDTLLARLSTVTNDALPPGVELSGIAPLGADFSVVGSAGSHAETLQYAANLRESPLFKDARIMRVDGAKGADPNAEGSVSFQIRLSVPTEAPSKTTDAAK